LAERMRRPEFSEPVIFAILELTCYIGQPSLEAVYD
jgi:hypothetical protein